MTEANRLADLSRVRVGAPEDIDEIFEMSTILHAENGIFALDETKVRAFLKRMLAQEDGIIGVIGPPGAIEASLCLEIASQWYSSVKFLSEVWNFCLPKYRRSENAKVLIEFAKACSLATQLPLMIGILSNQRTEAKVRLYQRQLGASAGAFWLHGAQTGQGEAHVRGQ